MSNPTPPERGAIRKLIEKADATVAWAGSIFHADEVRAAEAELAALEARDADFAQAAGELLVEIPEPGTVLSKLLSANVLMRRENADLRAQLAHVLLGMELALIDLPGKPLDAAATLKVFAARVSADASKEP